MSTFNVPPEVEDLSELQWKRVERNLMNALTEEPIAPVATRERRSSLWLAMPIAAAAACVAWLALGNAGEHHKSQAPEPEGETSSQALALATQPTGEHTRAPDSENSTRGPARSEIVTQDGGTTVQLGVARLDVEADSRVSILQDGSTLEFALQSGGLNLEVPPRDHEAPVSLVAAGVLVETVNASFSVHRHQETVEVSVHTGLVVLRSNDQRKVLRSGETWPKPTTQAKRPVAARRDARSQASPQERFDTAAQLEVRDPNKARKLYREVARGRGPWAANALFAEARLAISQGQPKLGQTLLQDYLRRFPKGPNARDATDLLRHLAK